MKRKGINYDVGIEFHHDYISRPKFDAAVMRRELEIIRQDLHCNAVRISGTAYGVKTSTEENRKGYPGFPTIWEQKSKLTMLEIGSVILKRSI